MSFRHKQARRSEAGNVFFALFGTIVLLGVLGATVSAFIKGPLTSSIRITRDSVADTQMSGIGQVIIMQSGAQAACDADAEVEPIEWRTGTTIPTGGGLLPTTLGVASTKDPWGTEYGYCAWDHGANRCGAGTRRLGGTNTNPDDHTVIAIISAGPDKTFSTTCRNFNTTVGGGADLANRADQNGDGDLDDATDRPLVSKANATDDDIIYTYSMSEASGASGGVGLWSLKSSDTNVATIGKNIDVTGNATFTGAGQFTGITTDSIGSTTTDAIDFLQGFRIPDAGTFSNACDGDLEGVIRRNGSSLEICVDDTWTVATGGGSGGSGGDLGGFTPDSTTVCDGTTLGSIRYNTATSRVEYCNGSTWRGLTAQSSTPVAVSASPTVATGMNATGPCFTLYCPYAYSTLRQFIVTSIGTGTTAALDIDFMGPNRNNFQLDNSQSTCLGATLSPSEKCIVTVRARADGNYNYNASFVVSSAGTPLVAVGLSGTGSGFGCHTGMKGWGGIVLTCTNSTTPDYILTEPGCPVETTNEPTCGADGALDPQMAISTGNYWPSLGAKSGAQNTVDYLSYGTGMAYVYCDQYIKSGYSDWFLPSPDEYESIIGPLKDILSMDATEYWTSRTTSGAYGGSDSGSLFNTTSRRVDNSLYANDTRSVRCMRRHGVALPTAHTDSYPDILAQRIRYSTEVGADLGHAFAQSSGETMISPQLVIRSINTSIPISVTGPGSPTISINGAAGVSSGTVRLNDVVTIAATGPTVTKTENMFQLQVGGRNYQWGIYYQPAVTAQIFVTSGVFNGNRSGITGVDTACQNAATSAGLTGRWFGLVGSGPTQTHPRYRIPWTWNRLENRGGEFVARNIDDLLDGTLSSPVRYNESGVFAPSKKVWVGVYAEDAVTNVPSGANTTCVGWTSSSSSYTAYDGDSGSAGFAFLWSWEDACNQTRSFYCVGPF